MTVRPPVFVLVGLCACVWALVLVVQLGAAREFGVLVTASPVVGVLATLLAAWPFVVARFGTRLIQGTWWGELRSNYSDPVTGRTPDPIPVAFMIRQSGTGLVACLFSPESESATIAASLIMDRDQRLALVGVYRNEPRLPRQETSRTHYGGIKLQVIDGAKKRLHGTYWTDRGTCGEIELCFVMRRYAHDYLDAKTLAEREGALLPAPVAKAEIAHDESPPSLPRSIELVSPALDPDSALCKLLESRFNEPELRRFITSVASRDAVARLPGEGAPLANLAFAIVELLHRDRLLDKMFQHLLNHSPTTPKWRTEVEGVRKRFRSPSTQGERRAPSGDHA